MILEIKRNASYSGSQYSAVAVVMVCRLDDPKIGF
jgi:hypothetical protein